VGAIDGILEEDKGTPRSSGTRASGCPKPCVRISGERQGFGGFEQSSIELADMGAWVHAYLHRKEGDVSNAAYWYLRAGRPQSRTSLDKEWAEIVSSLLDKTHQSR
jgi:hypothetical protein